MENVFEFYEVKENGVVVNKKTNRELKGSIDSYGYRVIGTWCNGVFKYYKHHRLIAMKFIPNPDNLPQVNHKDGNKLNNSIDNLEWVSAKTNTRHAHKNGLARSGINRKKVKQICPITKDIIKIYESAKEAGRELGIDNSSISQMCRKSVKKGAKKPPNSVGGFIWETCND